MNAFDSRLEITGTYAAKGLTGDEAEQHHIGFARALQNALDNMDDEWHGRGIAIQLEAWITRNPGTIGEYRAHCTSP